MFMSRQKRGSIQKLGRGRYRVWYYDATGRRRSEVVHGSERDAAACLAGHQEAPPETSTEAEPRLTFEVFYHDVYHPALLRRRLAPRTVEGYESQWRLVRDAVGGWDMRATSTRDIEAFVQGLPTAGKQQAAVKILRQMCRYAYSREYIDSDPTSRRIERSRRVPYYRRDTYTAAEARAVLETARQYIYYKCILLCMLGGLRRSEALGLLWRDLEPVDGGVVVHVSRTWQRRRGTKGAEAPTKTARSARDVVIPEPWSAALDPAGHDPSAGVVCEPRPNPDGVTRSWRAFCDANGLRYVSLQGMRATYSTILAGAGVTDAVVSDSLGHSVLSTRYKHYLMRGIDARRDVANALRDALQ